MQEALTELIKRNDVLFTAVNETEDVLEMRIAADQLAEAVAKLDDCIADVVGECDKADDLIEELRGTIEEVEATVEAMKPQTLHDEQKAEILKKLEVLDLETLQHLESVLGLQFAPPY
jgi:phage shock protein A